MKKFFSIIILMLFVFVPKMMADDTRPVIKIIAEVDTAGNGMWQRYEEGQEITGSAPMDARFSLDITNQGDYEVYYKWYICMQGDTIVRYDDITDFTFEKAGTWTVYFLGDIYNATDTMHITLDSYKNEGYTARTITISTSKLTFPNAFSPGNKDGRGTNDIYKAKTCESIVEFHGMIFNRWGQKLFEWSDPYSGWDGYYHGKLVKDGVYFAYIRAKGADGTEYEIKKDVNVLTTYDSSYDSSASTDN